MIELLEGTAVGCAIAFVSLGLARRLQVPAAVEEPRCLGYIVKTTHFNGTKKTSESTDPMHDCTALRSPTCMDGRCTFHCRDNCQCDLPRQGKAER